MGLLLLFTQDAGAPDVTAPEFVSAEYLDGPLLLITLSEAVQVGAGGATGFSLISAEGPAITLTYDSGAAAEIYYIPSREISDTETLTLSFVQPGNGIEDTAGNDLASFGPEAVTNSSTSNAAPSDITASASTISVNAADGAQLCVLTATDPDPGETFTWTKVAGIGDTNNAAVTIGAATGIVTVNSASTLGVGSYTFRVQVTDSATNTRAEAFAFSVVAAGTMSIYKFNDFKVRF